MLSDEKMEELKSTFRSKYYNAVSNCCFEVLALQENKYGISEEDLTNDEYEKIIEDAHEWFMIHFFEEQGLE